jgi:hypothetical protein
MLAQFGIKKPAIQRSLDALAEEGKITCKVKKRELCLLLLLLLLFILRRASSFELSFSPSLFFFFFFLTLSGIRQGQDLLCPAAGRTRPLQGGAGSPGLEEAPARGGPPLGGGGARQPQGRSGEG